MIKKKKSLCVCVCVHTCTMCTHTHGSVHMHMYTGPGTDDTEGLIWGFNRLFGQSPQTTVVHHLP